MSSKKILEIIGPYPPPYGGISTHIDRILRFLKRNNIDYVVHNHGYYSNFRKNISANNKKIFWYLKYLFVKNSNLVHFHQTLFGLHYLYWFIYSKLNRKNVIISLHNQNILMLNIFFRRISLWLLKNTGNSTIIVVSQLVHDYLIKNSIKSIYLPSHVPYKSKNEKIKSDSYIIFCNIWNVKNSSFIIKYGIDLILDLMKSNDNKYLLLYIFIGRKKNINIIKNEISARGLENNVNIIVDSNMVDHFYYADLFIRGNRDDAFGNSIQEAHDNFVPTISSNVCKRPNGTHLFESGDLNDLNQVFNQLYYKSKKELLQNVEKTKYHYELINIYKQLLKD